MIHVPEVWNDTKGLYLFNSLPWRTPEIPIAVTLRRIPIWSKMIPFWTDQTCWFCLVFWTRSLLTVYVQSGLAEAFAPNVHSVSNTSERFTVICPIYRSGFQRFVCVVENPLDYMDSSGSFIGQLITNASLAADTFFVLSGVVLTYSLLKKLEQNEGKLNWIWVYIRRWWRSVCKVSRYGWKKCVTMKFCRLTPLYAAVLMTFMYVVPTLVTGPFPLLVGQDTGGNPLDACKKYWWSNMLYINNFVPSDTRQQVRECEPNWTATYFLWMT